MDRWERLFIECQNCTKCGLHLNRTNVVIGRGNPSSSLMFVGEGPGEQEDLKGLPFVGPAGKLLDMLLESLYFKQNEYYIANIVKCRPPNNREPYEEEAQACLDFLREQFRLVRPKIVVCLGAVASKYLIDRDIKITQARGVWINKKGCWMIPTFHPAALLRDPSKKSAAFEDMRKVRIKYDELCTNCK